MVRRRNGYNRKQYFLYRPNGLMLTSVTMRLQCHGVCMKRDNQSAHPQYVIPSVGHHLTDLDFKIVKSSLLHQDVSPSNASNIKVPVVPVQ